MKLRKKLLLIPLALMSLTSCETLQGLEEEINVVFEYNGNIIYSDYATQFRNVIMPNLDESEIPVDCEFFGWTWKDQDSFHPEDEDFETNFFEKDGVIHYAEVKDLAFNSTVTLYPVFFAIDEIPVEYHYLAVGWYAKTSTSGLDQAKMDAWTVDLKEFLKTNGATDADLESVLVKPYDGDIATAGSLINRDRYCNVLVGFGGNIGSLGGVEFVENVSGIPMGGKTRYVTLITDDPLSRSVFEWIQTLAGQAALQ